ncbi:hypothetical protein OHC33_003395 [Knufia fluminis]|uniref:Uncharacterized protein n=1 Tax=Knufia fluminis TaxID=191047 RepID=A0AAN8EH80_9EURO|nr:hypothetical protein OHC33_003395 [Knufia fluminis]
MASSSTSTNSNTTMTFEKPRSLQALSPLMGRPMDGPEGRAIKTLTETTYLTPNEYRKSLDLSAQLLRTCQQLHEEGSAVLYTDNALSIFVERRADAIFFDHPLLCTVFNISLRMFCEHHEIPSEAFSLLDHAQSVKRSLKLPSTGTPDRDKYAQYCRQFGSAGKFIQYHATFARFEHVDITLDVGSQEDVLITCRFLRGIVQDKHVRFTALALDGDPFPFPDMLSPCRFLGCRSFEFTHDPEDGELKVYAQAITGQEIVHDTYNMWRSLSRVLGCLRIRERHGVDTFEDHHNLDDLQEAAFSYDLAKYKAEEKAVLELARSWNEERAKYIIEKATEDEEAMNDVMNDYLKHAGIQM